LFDQGVGVLLKLYHLTCKHLVGLARESIRFLAAVLDRFCDSRNFMVVFIRETFPNANHELVGVRREESAE
jgi:hypothetical protein